MYFPVWFTCTWEVGSPYLLGRVTLLGGPTYCHINTWGRATLLEGSTFVGSDYCQIAAKLGVFLLGDVTARTQSTRNRNQRGKGKGNWIYRQKTSLSAILVVLYLATAQLSPFAPNSVIAIALGTRLRMKRGLSFVPYRRVTLLRGSPYLHVNRPLVLPTGKGALYM